MSKLTLSDQEFKLVRDGLFYATRYCSLMIEAERSCTIPGTPDTPEIAAYRLGKRRFANLRKRLDRSGDK